MRWCLAFSSKANVMYCTLAIIHILHYDASVKHYIMHHCKPTSLLLSSQVIISYWLNVPGEWEYSGKTIGSLAMCLVYVGSEQIRTKSFINCILLSCISQLTTTVIFGVFLQSTDSKTVYLFHDTNSVMKLYWCVSIEHNKPFTIGLWPKPFKHDRAVQWNLEETVYYDLKYFYSDVMEICNNHSQRWYW